MSAGPTLPVAQLVFSGPTGVNPAFVLSDLRGIFERISPAVLTTNWDQDDLVTLELGSLRIVLCFDDGSNDAGLSHLTLAFAQHQALAGQSAERDLAADRLRAIAQWLVTRLTDRLSPHSLVWSALAEPLTADAVERIAHHLMTEATDRRAAPKRTVDWHRPVTDGEVTACLERMPKPQPARAKPQHRLGGLRPIWDRALRRFLQQSEARQVLALLVVFPLAAGLCASAVAPRPLASDWALSAHAEPLSYQPFSQPLTQVVPTGFGS